MRARDPHDKFDFAGTFFTGRRITLLFCIQKRVVAYRITKRFRSEGKVVEVSRLFDTICNVSAPSFLYFRIILLLYTSNLTFCRLECSIL
jgi:hypothetical protein